MPGFLFDTDHLSLFENAHSVLLARYASRPAVVSLATATVEESLRGRLAALSRARTGAMRILFSALLVGTVRLVNQFPIVPFNQVTEDEFQRLRGLRIRIGTQDLKIAAAALANQLTLLTRNKTDFARVPRLVIDDWSR